MKKTIMDSGRTIYVKDMEYGPPTMVGHIEEIERTIK